MVASFLPSFMTGWDFPAFPALPLSANLQKRLLSYILKRTLGHLVKGGQLDLDQIDAGIGSGRVEIRNVQLDAQAVQNLLPELPVSFQTGEIGRISVQLPLPNIWSGELTVTVTDVKVQFKVCALDASKADQSRSQETMSASFLSAASEILEQDPEGQDLEQSLNESIAGDKAGNDNGETSTIIGSYVEALLARLKFSLTNARFEVLSDHLDLCLVLSKASMHSTASGRAHTIEAGTSREEANRTSSESQRSVQLGTIEVWMLDKSEATFTFPSPSHATTAYGQDSGELDSDTES